MIHHGDCLDVLKTLAAESIDACVTDPPYGIGFMGKEWDTFKPGTGATRKLMHPRERVAAKIVSDNPNIAGRHRSPALSPSQIDYDYSAAGLRRFQAWTEEWAREVFRVLKPGAHIVVCGAPRAYHRMASGLEDAGFEIRDCLAWLFGSGFPKSLNLGDGLGTALKPAHEPIVLARKPFKGTVKGNVEKFGTGALNIDACRIIAPDGVPQFDRVGGPTLNVYASGLNGSKRNGDVDTDRGRWPANVVIDEIAALVIDEQSGELTSGDYSGERSSDKTRHTFGAFAGTGPRLGAGHKGDIGGASRFYYCAKPSREERDMGCYGLSARTAGECTDRQEGSAGLNNPRAGAGRTGGGHNFHPTVKPVELMRWLVKLVTPINGVVLDPFLGSGTTGMAARYEQRGFIGIEREADYIEIAERRIEAVAPLFAEASR